MNNTFYRYGKLMKTNEKLMHSDLVALIQSYHRQDHIDELKGRIVTILQKGKATAKMKSVLKFILSATINDFVINYDTIDFIKLNEQFYQRLDSLKEALSKDLNTDFRNEFLDLKTIISQDFTFYVQSIVKIQMLLNLINDAKTEQHRHLLFYALAQTDTSLSEQDNFKAGGKYKSITGSKKAQSQKELFENLIISFLKINNVPFYIKSKSTGKNQKNYQGIIRFLKQHTSKLEDFSEQRLRASLTNGKEVKIELKNTKIKRIIQPTGSQLNQKLEFIFRSPR